MAWQKRWTIAPLCLIPLSPCYYFSFFWVSSLWAHVTQGYEVKRKWERLSALKLDYFPTVISKQFNYLLCVLLSGENRINISRDVCLVFGSNKVSVATRLDLNFPGLKLQPTDISQVRNKPTSWISSLQDNQRERERENVILLKKREIYLKSSSFPEEGMMLGNKSGGRPWGTVWFLYFPFFASSLYVADQKEQKPLLVSFISNTLSSYLRPNFSWWTL